MFNGLYICSHHYHQLSYGSFKKAYHDTQHFRGRCVLMCRKNQLLLRTTTLTRMVHSNKFVGGRNLHPRTIVDVRKLEAFSFHVVYENVNKQIFLRTVGQLEWINAAEWCCIFCINVMIKHAVYKNNYEKISDRYVEWSIGWTEVETSQHYRSYGQNQFSQKFWHKYSQRMVKPWNKLPSHVATHRQPTHSRIVSTRCIVGHYYYYYYYCSLFRQMAPHSNSTNSTI